MGDRKAVAAFRPISEAAHIVGHTTMKYDDPRLKMCALVRHFQPWANPNPISAPNHSVFTGRMPFRPTNIVKALKATKSEAEIVLIKHDRCSSNATATATVVAQTQLFIQMLHSNGCCCCQLHDTIVTRGPIYKISYDL